jgi:hypothetical protein
MHNILYVSIHAVLYVGIANVNLTLARYIVSAPET